MAPTRYLQTLDRLGFAPFSLLSKTLITNALPGLSMEIQAAQRSDASLATLKLLMALEADQQDSDAQLARDASTELYADTQIDLLRLALVLHGLESGNPSHLETAQQDPYAHQLFSLAATLGRHDVAQGLYVSLNVPLMQSALLESAHLTREAMGGMMSDGYTESVLGQFMGVLESAAAAALLDAQLLRESPQLHAALHAEVNQTIAALEHGQRSDGTAFDLAAYEQQIARDSEAAFHWLQANRHGGDDSMTYASNLADLLLPATLYARQELLGREAIPTIQASATTTRTR